MSVIISGIFLLLSFFSFADDEVDILISRKHAKQVRMETLLSETKEIRYNTYVFDLDDTGKKVLGLLTDAAERGVKVKLIIDDWEQGLAKKPALLQALMDSGVEVKVFNPILSNPGGVNYRNHIKSLISDDELVVGGRNTQGHYFKEYIDVEAHVKGPQVDVARKHYDSVFDSDRVKVPRGSKNAEDVLQAKQELRQWGKIAREKYLNPMNKHKKHSTKVEKLAYVADSPALAEKRANGINKQVIAMIDRAEKNLDLMNPYVLVSPEERDALQRAIDRGVKVRISTNSSAVTDSKLVALAWNIKKKELVDMGIEVYESGQYIHAKTMVRDKKEVFIGSFNMDMRSHNLNLENGIFFENKKLASELDVHQRRIARRFTTRYERTREKSRTILHKGGRCVQEGINRLITTIVYPIL